MTNVTEIIEEVTERMRLQPTAISEFDEDSYEFYVKISIRDLYVQTGRADQYTPDLYLYVRGTLYLADDLLADEIEYIVLTAMMNALDAIRKASSQMVSYTTDALSVTGGDKPYKNISGEVESLDQKRRRIFHTMNRYTVDGVADF